MKKGLFFPCLLAATISFSFLLFHSCNDDDKISQPMEEVDPLLDTSVSPDFCHAILIIGVDEDYTSARILEDSLKFDYIFFPTSDLEGLRVSPQDSIYVRILSARRLDQHLSIPEDAFKRSCQISLCK